MLCYVTVCVVLYMWMYVVNFINCIVLYCMLRAHLLTQDAQLFPRACRLSDGFRDTVSPSLRYLARNGPRQPPQPQTPVCREADLSHTMPYRPRSCLQAVHSCEVAGSACLPIACWRGWDGFPKRRVLIIVALEVLGNPPTPGTLPCLGWLGSMWSSCTSWLPSSRGHALPVSIRLRKMHLSNTRWTSVCKRDRNGSEHRLAEAVLNGPLDRLEADQTLVDPARAKTL